MVAALHWNCVWKESADGQYGSQRSITLLMLFKDAGNWVNLIHYHVRQENTNLETKDETK